MMLTASDWLRMQADAELVRRDRSYDIEFRRGETTLSGFGLFAVSVRIVASRTRRACSIFGFKCSGGSAAMAVDAMSVRRAART